MSAFGLAPHEAMEIHEVMAFKTACVAKAGVMRGMVRDPQLDSLLQEDIARGTQHLRDLQGLIQGAVQGTHMQGR